MTEDRLTHPPANNAELAPALQVDRVSFSYGGTKALNEVSLTLPSGDVVGLIGPNGSGKSTLINLVSGAERGKAQGSIRLFGEDIGRLHPSRRAAKGMSRIFQGIRLFDSLTIEQNVLLGAYSTFRHSFIGSVLRSPRCRAETRRAREKAADAMSVFGERIYPRRNQQVLSLSYANRRRVEIARALMNDPRLLLLDEPTAGMNPHETEELTSQLDTLSRDRGMSMLLVEHKMSVIGDLCKNVFVLDAGVVIAEGSPSYVQAHPRVMEAFLGTA